MAPAPAPGVLVGRRYRQPNPTITIVDIPPQIGQFAQQMKMNVCQINTQRMYGPSLHLDQSWMPEPGSEVFVGRLPRDMYEPELVPFLEEAGPIYQLRLMMDFSGTNKGYCFVRYLDPEQAQLAVDLLNQRQVRPGMPVVVSKSLDNSRLLLSGVPTAKTQEEVDQTIRQIFGGVVSVELTWDVDNPATPNGIVYVTFSCHRAAALARKRMLSATPFYLWENRIIADWAEPIIQPHKNFRSSHVLLIKSFNPGTGWRLLMEYFNILSISGVKFIQMSRRGIQAYVFFQTRMQAEAAKAVLQDASFFGCKLQVRWWTPERVPEGRRRTYRPRCLVPIEPSESSGEMDGIYQQLSIEIPQVELEIPVALSLSPYFQPCFAQPNYEYLPVYIPSPPSVTQCGYVDGVAAFPEQSPAFWTVPLPEPVGYQPVYLGYSTIERDWNGEPAGILYEVDGRWVMDWNSDFPSM